MKKARFEEEGVNSKMDGKSRHPFAITCRYCGSNSVTVIAYEYRDLGIICNSCEKTISCGIYYLFKSNFAASLGLKSFAIYLSLTGQDDTLAKLQDCLCGTEEESVTKEAKA